jgi:hypothetical protein
MKKLLRWAVVALIVAGVLAGIALWLLDDVARSVARRVVEDRTGLETRIGRLEIGLRQPRLTVREFTLFHPEEFGGSVLVHLPEVHLEYDREALRDRKLRLTLLRIHLEEISVVTNRSGTVNFPFVKPSNGFPPGTPRRAGDMEFAGIERLELTLGRVRFLNLEQPDSEQESEFGIEDASFIDVNDEEDFQAVLTVIALRSGMSWMLDLLETPDLEPRTPNLEPRTLFPATRTQSPVSSN